MSGHYVYGEATEENGWQAPATWVEDVFYDAFGNSYATQEEATAADTRVSGSAGSGGSGNAASGNWFSTRYLKNGSLDWVQAAKDFGSLAAAKFAWDQAKNPPRTGYQGTVNMGLTAERAQANVQDPNVRPGAGGHRYMTDVGYADPKDTAGLAALQANIAKQKTDIDTANSAFDVAQLERQRLANLPNAITPDQFYGRVTPVPMTDAQKVKVPTATIGTLPADQFNPETPDAGHITPAAKFDPSNPLATKPPLVMKAGTYDLTPQEKAAYYNDLLHQGYTDAEIRTAADVGVKQTNADWTELQRLAAPVVLPAGIGDKTPAEKAAEYNNQIALGKTDAQIRAAAGPQTNANWTALQGLATQAKAAPVVSAGLPALTLQAGIGDQTPQQKAAYYNTLIGQGYNDAAIRTAAGPQTDENWAALQGLAGVKTAAQGGLMGLARGGSTNPRYLRGATDGMADKIPARIDGQQEAALAHGEFVVPADVVSHLGNGNSDAGADVLYKMMDKIRKARTGNKKQGKQIDPNKFTPGGLAYAAGGSVLHFAGTTGSAVPAGTVGVEENLSSWAGPYVTGMLGKGQALSEAPYQAYQGPLTAGDSALQTQGFQNAANLQTPTSIGQAANTAGNVATNFNTLANAGYPTSQAVNQFTAPGQYQAMNSENQFTVPGQYVAANNTATTFGNDQAQAYMNPYLQQSLDPQLQEARRQSQITQQANNAQATQAGAFGGARQGIMAAENQRNLGSNLANITGQGYNTAYTNAQQQFNADQARQQATQNANEASRQFGANYGMTGAQQAAQYGQAAQQANEASRQFGANYGMTGAQQSAQYGQAAQAQNEASNQFSANYGLQALQGQLSAAQAQGNLGATQNASGLANLQAQLAAGATQQATAQAGMTADQAAFNAERDNPYKMVQYQQSLLAGLPITAQQYNISTNPYIAASATLGEATTVAG